MNSSLTEHTAATARVAVIGEGVIDRFLRPEGAEDVIGGSPLNTTVALRRAGVDATWWNRVSTDAEGQAILAYAESEGVAGIGIVRSDLPSSVVTISLDAAGVPTYGFALEGAADWAWSEAELEGFGHSFDLLQIGSLTTVLEPGSSALLARLRRLRAQGQSPLVSFDPNARPKAAKDEVDAQRMRERVLEFLPLADLVKVSDEDLEWLSPGVPPSATASQWSTQGPKLVVMTRGAEGASAFVEGVKVADVPVFKLPLVDTVGAGDTFMAWLIRSVVIEHDCQIPTNPEQVLAMLNLAAKAAAINCSRRGCNPPTVSDLAGV